MLSQAALWDSGILLAARRHYQRQGMSFSDACMKAREVMEAAKKDREQMRAQLEGQRQRVTKKAAPAKPRKPRAKKLTRAKPHPKITERVDKLLDMAGHPNTPPEEAGNAGRKAAQLMRENGLTAQPKR
jgi:hypothetical protein